MHKFELFDRIEKILEENSDKEVIHINDLGIVGEAMIGKEIESNTSKSEMHEIKVKNNKLYGIKLNLDKWKYNLNRFLVEEGKYFKFNKAFKPELCNDLESLKYRLSVYKKRAPKKPIKGSIKLLTKNINCQIKSEKGFHTSEIRKFIMSSLKSMYDMKAALHKDKFMNDINFIFNVDFIYYDTGQYNKILNDTKYNFKFDFVYSKKRNECIINICTPMRKNVFNADLIQKDVESLSEKCYLTIRNLGESGEVTEHSVKAFLLKWAKQNKDSIVKELCEFFIDLDKKQVQFDVTDDFLILMNNQIKENNEKERLNEIESRKLREEQEDEFVSSPRLPEMSLTKQSNHYCHYYNFKDRNSRSGHSIGITENYKNSLIEKLQIVNSKLHKDYHFPFSKMFRKEVVNIFNVVVPFKETIQLILKNEINEFNLLYDIVYDGSGYEKMIMFWGSAKAKPSLSWKPLPLR